MDLARRVGPEILDGRPVGSGGPARAMRLGRRWSTGRCKNALGLGRIRVGYTAGEAIGPEIFAFYRALGDQPQAALRPDRGERLHHPAARRRGRADTVGVPTPGRGDPDRGKRRGFYRSPGVFVEYFREPGEHRRDQGRRGLGGDRRRRLHRAGHGAPADHRPGQGRGPDGRTAACSRRSMWRTS